uniref:Uncharacterized protein n=1 Tax=Setaria italica TaxID=4555 RepID=K3ZGM0_SETIT
MHLCYANDIMHAVSKEQLNSCFVKNCNKLCKTDSERKYASVPV